MDLQRHMISNTTIQLFMIILRLALEVSYMYLHGGGICREQNLYRVLINDIHEHLIKLKLQTPRWGISVCICRRERVYILYRLGI